MKVLIFHNTLPEYRIKWFKNIADKCDSSFIFTSDFVYEKLYNIKIDYTAAEQLDCQFLKPGISGYIQLWHILKDINKYDFILYPPTDSFRELVMSLMILKYHREVKTGYFWEKWEAPKAKQPIKRKIKNWILGLAAKMIYDTTDVIFSGGSKSREYFIQHGADERKIVCLPDSCELPNCEFVDIRKKYEIPLDVKIILYFGRLIKEKGADILIEAFSGFSDRYWLLVAGDGELMHKCVQIGKKISNITFAGQIEPRIRRNYFEQCDLFIFPVTYRGGCVDVWGLTLNEAVSVGKPVISTDAVGSAYDLIDEGENGFRIEPENVESLRSAIKEAFCLDLDIVKKKNEEKMMIYNFENMAEVFVNTATKVVSDGVNR